MRQLNRAFALSALITGAGAFVSLLSVLAGVTQAQTIIGETTYEAGTVVTWAKSGSPYLINGTVTVGDSAWLTVAPGCSIVFQGNHQLVVYGKLTALGWDTVTVPQHLTVDSVIFTADTPEGWGGIRLENASITSRLEYCHFEAGHAQGNEWPNSCGGALYIYGTIQTVKHCSFVDNQAEMFGGAVFVWGGSPEFSYNFFTQNRCTSGSGHALYLGNSAGLVLDQITLAGNDYDSLYFVYPDSFRYYGYSLYVADGSTLVMRNSILWDDSRFFDFNNGDLDYNDVRIPWNEDASQFASTTLAQYGDGNFSREPHFLDKVGGDLRIYEYSPTVDAASVTAPYIGFPNITNDGEPPPNGGRANLGAYANGALATVSIPQFSFVRDTLVTQNTVLNFGLQKKALPDTLVDSLYNVGRQPLIINSVVSSDTQFYTSFPPTGMTIAPDGAAALSYFFAPDTIDSISGAITFYTNDTLSTLTYPNDSLRTAVLMGVGVDPVPFVTLDTMDFGLVAVGNPVEEPFWIYNNGPPEPINGIISDLWVTIFNSSNNFIIHDALGVYPVLQDTIPPGDSLLYYMECDPSGQLTYIEDIPITTNAGIIYKHVKGTGRTPETHYDTDTLDYSVWRTDTSSTDTVKIWNMGNAYLTLNDISMTGTQFSIMGNFLGDSIGFVGDSLIVNKPDTLAIPVKFQPTNPGAYIDTLNIETNELIAIINGVNQYYTIRVILLGTGTDLPYWWIGNVSGHWTSPADTIRYIVGPIQVPTGETLTIDPGVQVKFDGRYEFTIHGTLLAEGTAEDSIVFTTVDADSHWAGLTFLEGSDASHVTFCDLTKGLDTLYGGVLKVENAAPLLEHCTFHGNRARYGGAAVLNIGALPTFRYCDFYDNRADSSGGAIFSNWLSDAQIEFCHFYNDSAKYGGALYLSGADGRLYGSEIHDNYTFSSSLGKGGGLYLGNGAVTELDSCLIYNNRSYQGGGLAIVWNTKPYIHDSFIYHNTAVNVGGGVLIQDGCQPVLHNTLIADNYAATAKGLFTSASSAIVDFCTIVDTMDVEQDGWLLTASWGDQSIISNSILGAHTWDSTFAYSAVLDTSTNVMISFSDVYEKFAIIEGIGGPIAIYHLLHDGQENQNDDPVFNTTWSSIFDKYELESGSPALGWSEGNSTIGYTGVATPLIGQGDVTLALLQNPVQLNSFNLVLTSTIPLMAPPYVRLLQDFPDTVGYTLMDSAFMISIAPIVYTLPLFQAQPEFVTTASVNFTNILGEPFAWESIFTVATLPNISSILGYGNAISVTARSLSGTALIGIMPETYTAPKPLNSGWQALGGPYQIISTTQLLADGRIEFTIPPESLNGQSPQHCAIARWDGETWQLLLSYLNDTQTVVWSTLETGGSYRLIWSSAARSVMLPAHLELAQNYPNPFNPETTVRFGLPETGWVSLKIYDLLGREVITLVEGQYPAGYHQAHWSGANAFGHSVASGIYFYRLQMGGQFLHKKMILLR